MLPEHRFGLPRAPHEGGARCFVPKATFQEGEKLLGGFRVIARKHVRFARAAGVRHRKLPRPVTSEKAWIGRKAKGETGPAAAQLGKLFRAWEPQRAKLVTQDVFAHGRKRPNKRAGANSRGNAVEHRRGQKEFGVRGRIFNGLQEQRGGRGGELVDVFNKNDPCVGAYRALMNVLQEADETIAHGGVLQRFQTQEIWVRRQFRLGINGEKFPRGQTRDGSLPDARWADQKHCRGKPVSADKPLEKIPRRLMPDQGRRFRACGFRHSRVAGTC